MELININKTFDIKDKPRHLTSEEINSILDKLPETFGVNDQENENIREAIQTHLREILTHKKVAPSRINAVANEMVKFHVESRINPGSTVGTHCSESVSQPCFQATMNAFHNAGQSKAGMGGINEFEELFYAKKTRKVELCTIHYKNKQLSYEEVLDTKKDIEACMMSQFIQDKLYIKEGDKYVKDYIIDTYDQLPKKWWHDNEHYIELIESKIPNPNDFVLRIHLNVKEMFRYKVSLQDLVDAFKRENDSPIHLLYGSMQDAIIDIYACADFSENKKGQMLLEAVECNEDVNDMATASFYNTMIMPSLNNLRIKGVSGITDLTPIVTPVISIIIDDDRICWMLYYENMGNALKLFELLNVNVLRKTDSYLVLSLPKYDDISFLFNKNFDMNKEKYLSLNPIEYIDLVIKNDKKNNPKNKQTNLIKTFNAIKKLQIVKVFEVNLSHKRMYKSGIDENMLSTLFDQVGIIIVENDKGYNPKLLVKLDYDALKYKSSIKEDESFTPRSLINKCLSIDKGLKKYTELVYAEVVGNNLRGLLSLPFLDKTRVKSNNMHVTAAVYGIRAARKLFLDELYDSMSSFGVHPQHYILIADVFFSRGIPTGAMYNSSNKQLGPVDKATVSKAVEVFKNASLQGISHDISGVSTHIAFGINTKIGTGYATIAYLGKNKTSINNELYTAFKNEQNYIDRMANEVQPVTTDDPNEDLKDKYEEDDKPLSKPSILRGKKVNLEYEEPVIIDEPVPSKTIPVSKYAKKTVEEKVPVSKYAKKTVEEKVPVSKYAKKTVEPVEEKVPVSKYAKKTVEETVPVSKYAKKNVDPSDISKKSRK